MVSIPGPYSRLKCVQLQFSWSCIAACSMISFPSVCDRTPLRAFCQTKLILTQFHCYILWSLWCFSPSLKPARKEEACDRYYPYDIWINEVGNVLIHNHGGLRQYLVKRQTTKTFWGPTTSLKQTMTILTPSFEAPLRLQRSSSLVCPLRVKLSRKSMKRTYGAKDNI